MTQNRTWGLKGLLLFTLVMMMTNANAATLEKLMMPGPVIEDHARVEDQCTSCHTRGSKPDENTRCLKCHERIDKDRRNVQGYHGRSVSARKNECRACHTEHIGRDADIIGLNRQTFNHNETDFALRGEHRNQICTTCHKPRKAYHEANRNCYSCHRDDDTHRGKLGNRCGTCHTEKRWKQVTFNHNKTDYPLKGKHRKAECNACHINERYKKTPDDCFSCHSVNDRHNGAQGRDCAKCHTPRNWDAGAFDHDRKTDFPLQGGHKEVECEACHLDQKRHKKARGCNDCHNGDDRHNGLFGKRCHTCHNDKAWQTIRFRHNTDTKFVLDGKHKQLACHDCHSGNLYTRPLKTTCYSCHKTDDVHKGKQSKKCNTCHNTAGWIQKLRFDHDLTHFPLNGMHATTPCEECHDNAEYKGTTSSCNNCHEDYHKKSLGTKCQRCHTPNHWRIWQFNHNRETEFLLDGSHRGLECELCHVQPLVPGSQNRNCIACHADDDTHEGQFGLDCSRCHNITDFREITLPR